MAKKITWSILIISFIVGVILLFCKDLAMERFKVFVEAIAFLYVPLVASIGTNSVVETLNSKGDKDERCLD